MQGWCWFCGNGGRCRCFGFMSFMTMILLVGVHFFLPFCLAFSHNVGISSHKQTYSHPHYRGFNFVSNERKWDGVGGDDVGTLLRTRTFSPQQAQSNPSEIAPNPWATATLDYSAANEYIQAHYRHINTSIPPCHQRERKENDGQGQGEKDEYEMYFQRYNGNNGTSTRSSDDGDGHQFVTEPIYNARELLTKSKFKSDHDLEEQRRHMLQQYGMTLIQLKSESESEPSSSSKSKVMDWRNVTQIQNVYLSELEEHILPTLFPSKILMSCFWNPMLRGENHTMSERYTVKNDQQSGLVSTSSIASMVHIDTDVGAYESLHDFLSLIENNRIDQGTCASRDENENENDQDCGDTFDMEGYAKAIMDGKRFLIMNFWRSTNHDVPVTSSPLAILSTRYGDADADIEVEQDAIATGGSNASSTHTTNGSSCRPLLAFPNVRPNMEQSRWYVFPNMTNDEVLTFYQYDRLVTQPSDLWHCAVSLDNNNDTSMVDTSAWVQLPSSTSPLSPPRESFDIRALVVLDEDVPLEMDRFHAGRLRPLLSLEESGCFCDEQALKRSGEGDI